MTVHRFWLTVEQQLQLHGKDVPLLVHVLQQLPQHLNPPRQNTSVGTADAHTGALRYAGGVSIHSEQSDTATTRVFDVLLVTVHSLALA